MAIFDFSAQGMVHSLEQGKLAPVVRVSALVAMVVALSVVYMFVQFAGLKHPDAMDQAQIARSIAAGEGFSTKYIRPLALWQLEASGLPLPEGPFPDFSQQPAVPFLNALPLALAKGSWKMSPLDIVYVGDRIVVFTSTLFFLLSCAVWYFVAKRLFDEKLAALAVAAVLLTDLLWQFSISGLPQMLLLFLFSLACLLTLKAVEVRHDNPKAAWFYLPATGAVFGLMILAHGLAFWPLAGWAAFMVFVFRRKYGPVLLALLVCLAVVSPWLARNYTVCGNPFGLNIYSALDPGQDPEMKILRELGTDFKAGGRGLRSKIQNGIIQQASNLFSYLGLNILAAAFFFSLLHSFRSPDASVFRWGVLLMWLSAAFGMAVFGVREDPVSSNQMHVLFLPLFVIYGAAFVLVLWNRLDFESLLLGQIFKALLLFLVAVPMLATMFLRTPPRIQWPPYIPPFIAVLGNWYEEDEILCSDMPWAIAWYADRKTILLPDSPRTLTRISDYRVLGSPVVGLYLTPLTGNQPLVSQIYKGAYKEWARLITRPPETQGFFLKAYTPLPIDGECIIFADSERWMKR